MRIYIMQNIAVLTIVNVWFVRGCDLFLMCMCTFEYHWCMHTTDRGRCTDWPHMNNIPRAVLVTSQQVPRRPAQYITQHPHVSTWSTHVTDTSSWKHLEIYTHTHWHKHHEDQFIYTYMTTCLYLRLCTYIRPCVYIYSQMYIDTDTHSNIPAYYITQHAYAASHTHYHRFIWNYTHRRTHKQPICTHTQYAHTYDRMYNIYIQSDVYWYRHTSQHTSPLHYTTQHTHAASHTHYHRLIWNYKTRTHTHTHTHTNMHTHTHILSTWTSTDIYIHDYVCK